MWKTVTWIFGRLPLSDSNEWVRGVAKTRKMAEPFLSPAPGAREDGSMGCKNPLALVGILAAAVNLVAWPAMSRAEQVNAVTELRALASTVEITVTSSKSFPVRALPPVLTIGDARFTLSRNPVDGRLDTLIFIVPAEGFALLPDGDPIRVRYGLTPGAPSALDPARGDVWDFGNLDKSRLQE
jgi:hypothetical protein